MKKTLLLTICLLTVLLNFAQVQMPAASSTQTLVQDFGLGTITIVYSRPSLKGRAVFMENSALAPVGKVWRTGANAATRLSFSDWVEIGGKKLDTGSYALYTIPGKKEWEIIINKGVNNDGAFNYKESEDVVRVKVPVSTISPAVETFTMQVIDIKHESCTIVLRWGTTAVGIPVTTQITERIKTKMAAALQGDKKPYWQAANFYYDWTKDYPNALTNVNSAIAESEKGGDSPYFMYLLKAKIQKDMNDKTGAKTSATKCVELATKEKNDDYVRAGNDLIKSL